MPARKLTGMPRAKPGEKFLVIKEKERNKFIVIPLPRRRKTIMIRRK